MGKHAAPREETGHWRRRVGVVTGIALTAGAIVGVAAAAPTTSTTNVAFVTLTPAHKLLSNTTISANKSTSPVVIGGTTTVPSNATTVQLTVSAKGAAAGTLNFYPAGNPSGGSGQALSWTAGATVSGTIQENVGMSGELTFANSSSGSVAVTATIIGYSTQVTAGDIGGTGGSSGQVLTNNGTGGASWQAAGGASYSSMNAVGINGTQRITDSLAVPAGSYFVSAHYDAGSSSAPDFALCALVSPDGSYSQYSNGDMGTSDGAYFGSDSVEVLMTTAGGNITLQCYTALGHAAAFQDTIVATGVSSAGGVVISAKRGQPTNNGAVPSHP